MTDYPRRKNDGTKSITLRKEFWKEFKGEIEKKVSDLHGTHRYYSGYACGLFRSKRITEERYTEIVKHLEEAIACEEAKRKRESIQIIKEEKRI